MSGEVRSGWAQRGELALGADVVVVGSGAGGMVVAAELAEAGRSVIVLEEGPYVANAEYGSMRPSESLRHVWRDGGMSVAIGVGDSPSINVTMGRAVGGSSLVTGGVCFRVPDSVCRVWAREMGLSDLTPEGLDPYYRRVEEAVHVEEVPVDLRSRSTALFAEGAERLGISVKSMKRNTRGCNGCGRCNFGCPHGAKMSVDLSYMPRALARGARIWSDTLVEQVRVEHDRVIGVRGRFLNREGGKPGDAFTVRASSVVVAAGAVHTPLLLARSGLAGRSGMLGRNLTLHPGFRVFATFDERVAGWQGALQSTFIDDFEPDGITLTSLFVPIGVLAATMPGIGPEHVQRAKEIPHLAMFGGIIHDHGGGRIWRVPGREPVISYRMDRGDRAKIPTIIRRMAEIFFAAGAKQVYLPVMGLAPVDADGLRAVDLEHVPARRIECSSQHPLGSCRMGTDPDTSVVDPFGRVWGVKGLYIADGSIVPTSLGVNPQLSIMTLATRIALHMHEGNLRTPRS